MMKKRLLVMIFGIISACQSVPIGDYCDVYSPPTEITKINRDYLIDQGEFDSVIANMYYYKNNCEEKK